MDDEQNVLYDDSDRSESLGINKFQGIERSEGIQKILGNTIPKDYKPATSRPTYLTDGEEAKQKAELDLATGVEHVIDDISAEEYVSTKRLYEKNLGVTQYDELRAKLHLKDNESFTDYYNRTHYIPEGFQMQAKLLLAEEKRKKLYAEVEAGNMSEEDFLYEAYGKDLLKQQGVDFSSPTYWYQQYKKDRNFQDPRKNDTFMLELIEESRKLFQEEVWYEEANTKSITDLTALVTGEVLDDKTVAELFPEFFANVSDDYETLNQLIKYYRAGLLQNFNPTIDTDGDGKVDYYYAPDGKLYNVNETGEGANTFKAYYNDDGSLNRIVRANSKALEIGSEFIRGIAGLFTGIVDLGALLIGAGHDLIDGGEFGDTLANYQANVTSFINGIPIIGEQDYVKDGGWTTDDGSINGMSIGRGAANLIGYIVPSIVLAVCTAGGSLGADAAKAGVKEGAKAGAKVLAKKASGKAAKEVAEEAVEGIVKKTISDTVAKRTAGQIIKGFAKKAGQTAVALTKYQYGFGATGWGARLSSALTVAVKDTLQTTVSLKVNQEHLGLSDSEIITKSLALGGMELATGILLRSVGDESALSALTKKCNKITVNPVTNNPMVKGFFNKIAANSLGTGGKITYGFTNAIMDGFDNMLSAVAQTSLMTSGEFISLDGLKAVIDNPQFSINMVYQGYQNYKDVTRISAGKIMESTVNINKADTITRTAFNTVIDELETKLNTKGTLTAKEQAMLTGTRQILTELDEKTRHYASQKNVELEQDIKARAKKDKIKIDKETSKLKAKVKGYNKKVSDIKQDIKQTSELIATTSKDLTNAKRAATKANNELTKAQEVLNKAKTDAEISAANTEVTKAQEKAFSTSDTVTELTTKLETLNKNLDKSNKDLSSFSSELKLAKEKRDTYIKDHTISEEALNEATPTYSLAEAKLLALSDVMEKLDLESSHPIYASLREELSKPISDFFLYKNKMIFQQASKDAQAYSRMAKGFFSGTLAKFIYGKSSRDFQQNVMKATYDYFYMKGDKERFKQNITMDPYEQWLLDLEDQGNIYQTILDKLAPDQEALKSVLSNINPTTLAESITVETDKEGKPILDKKGRPKFKVTSVIQELNPKQQKALTELLSIINDKEKMELDRFAVIDLRQRHDKTAGDKDFQQAQSYMYATANYWKTVLGDDSIIHDLGDGLYVVRHQGLGYTMKELSNIGAFVQGMTSLKLALSGKQSPERIKAGIEVMMLAAGCASKTSEIDNVIIDNLDSMPTFIETLIKSGQFSVKDTTAIIGYIETLIADHNRLGGTPVSLPADSDYDSYGNSLRLTEFLRDWDELREVLQPRRVSTDITESDIKTINRFMQKYATMSNNGSYNYNEVLTLAENADLLDDYQIKAIKDIRNFIREKVDTSIESLKIQRKDGEGSSDISIKDIQDYLANTFSHEDLVISRKVPNNEEQKVMIKDIGTTEDFNHYLSSLNESSVKGKTDEQLKDAYIKHSLEALKNIPGANLSESDLVETYLRTSLDTTLPENRRMEAREYYYSYINSAFDTSDLLNTELNNIQAFRDTQVELDNHSNMVYIDLNVLSSSTGAKIRKILDSDPVKAEALSKADTIKDILNILFPTVEQQNEFRKSVNTIKALQDTYKGMSYLEIPMDSPVFSTIMDSLGYSAAVITRLTRGELFVPGIHFNSDTSGVKISSKADANKVLTSLQDIIDKSMIAQLRQEIKFKDPTDLINTASGLITIIKDDTPLYPNDIIMTSIVDQETFSATLTENFNTILTSIKQGKNAGALFKYLLTSTTGPAIKGTVDERLEKAIKTYHVITAFADLFDKKQSMAVQILSKKQASVLRKNYNTISNNKTNKDIFAFFSLDNNQVEVTLTGTKEQFLEKAFSLIKDKGVNSLAELIPLNTFESQQNIVTRNEYSKMTSGYTTMSWLEDKLQNNMDVYSFVENYGYSDLDLKNIDISTTAYSDAKKLIQGLSKAEALKDLNSSDNVFVQMQLNAYRASNSIRDIVINKLEQLVDTSKVSIDTITEVIGTPNGRRALSAALDKALLNHKDNLELKSGYVEITPEFVSKVLEGFDIKKSASPKQNANITKDTTLVTGSQLSTLNPETSNIKLSIEEMTEILKLIPLEYSVLTGKRFSTVETDLLAMIKSASHCKDGSLAISSKDLYGLDSEGFKILSSIVDSSVQSKLKTIEESLKKSTYYNSRHELREVEKKLENIDISQPSKASTSGDIADLDYKNNLTSLDIEDLSLPQTVKDELIRLTHNAKLFKATDQFVKISTVKDSKYQQSYEMQNLAKLLNLSVLPYVDHQGSLLLQNLNIEENLYFFYHNLVDFSKELQQGYGLNKETAINIAFEYYKYSTGMQSQAAHPDYILVDTKSGKVVDIALSGTKSDQHAGLIARLYNNYFEPNESKTGIKFKESFEHTLSHGHKETIHPKNLIALKLNTNVIGTTFNKGNVNVDIYDIGNNENKFIQIFLSKIHAIEQANNLNPKSETYRQDLAREINNYFYTTEYASVVGKNREILQAEEGLFFDNSGKAFTGDMEQLNVLSSSLSDATISFKNTEEIAKIRSDYSAKERDINDLIHYGVTQDTLNNTEGLLYYKEATSKAIRKAESSYTDQIFKVKEDLISTHTDIKNILDAVKPFEDSSQAIKEAKAILDPIRLEQDNIYKEIKTIKEALKNINKERIELYQKTQEDDNGVIAVVPGTKAYSTNAARQRDLGKLKDEHLARLDNLYERANSNNEIIEDRVLDIYQAMYDIEDTSEAFTKVKALRDKLTSLKELKKDLIDKASSESTAIKDIVDLYKDQRMKEAIPTIQKLVSNSSKDKVAKQLIYELVRQDNSVEGTLFKLLGYNLDRFKNRDFETRIQIGKDEVIKFSELLSKPFIVLDSEGLYNNKDSHIYEVSILVFDGTNIERATKYIPYFEGDKEITDIPTLLRKFPEFAKDYYKEYEGTRTSINNLVNHNNKGDFDGLINKAIESNAILLGFNSKNFDMPKLIEQKVLPDDILQKLNARHVDVFDIVKSPINNLNLYGGRAALVAIAEQVFGSNDPRITQLKSAHFSDTDNDLVVQVLKELIVKNSTSFTSKISSDIENLYKQIYDKDTLDDVDYNNIKQILTDLNNDSELNFYSKKLDELKTFADKVINDPEHFQKVTKLVGLINERDVISRTNVLIKALNKLIRTNISSKHSEFANAFSSASSKNALIKAIAFSLRHINPEGVQPNELAKVYNKALTNLTYKFSKGYESSIIDNLVANSKDIYTAFGIDINSQEFKDWDMNEGYKSINKVTSMLQTAYGENISSSYKQARVMNNVARGLSVTHDYIDSFDFLPTEIKTLMHNLSDNPFDYKGDYNDLMPGIHLDSLSNHDKATMDWVLTDPLLTSKQVGIYRKATATSGEITLLKKDSNGNNIKTLPKNMTIYLTEQNYRDLMGYGKEIVIDPNNLGYIGAIRYPADKFDSIHYLKVELMEESNLKTVITPDTMLLLNGDLDGDNVELIRPDKLQSAYAEDINKAGKYSTYTLLDEITEAVMRDPKRDKLKDLDTTRLHYKALQDDTMAKRIVKDLDKLYSGTASYEELKQAFYEEYKSYGEKLLDQVYIKEATDLGQLLSDEDVVYVSHFAHPTVLQYENNIKAKKAIMIANAVMHDLVALNDTQTGMFQKGFLTVDYSQFDFLELIDNTIRISDTTKEFLDQITDPRRFKTIIETIGNNNPYFNKVLKRYSKVLNNSNLSNSDKIETILKMEQLRKLKSDLYITSVNNAILKLKDSAAKDPEASKFVTAFTRFENGESNFFKSIRDIVNIKRTLQGNSFTFGSNKEFLELLYTLVPQYAPKEANQEYNPGKEGNIVHIFSDEIDSPEDTIQWVSWTDENGKPKGSNEWVHLSSANTHQLSSNDLKRAMSYSRGQEISQADAKAFGIKYNKYGTYIFMDCNNGIVTYLRSFNIDTSKVMVEGNANTKSTPTKTMDISELPPYLQEVFKSHDAKAIMKVKREFQKGEKISARYNPSEHILFNNKGEVTTNIDEAIGYVSKEKLNVLENSLTTRSNAKEVKLEESAIGNNLLGTGGIGFTYGVFLRKTDNGSELVFDSSKYRAIKQYIDSLSQHDRFSTDATDLYEHLAIASIVNNMSSKDLNGKTRKELFLRAINGKEEGSRRSFIEHYLPKFQNVSGRDGLVLNVDLKNRIYGTEGTGVNSSTQHSFSNNNKGVTKASDFITTETEVRGSNTEFWDMQNPPNVTTAELHNALRLKGEGLLLPKDLKQAEQMGYFLNRKIEDPNNPYAIKNNNNPKTSQNISQYYYKDPSYILFPEEFSTDTEEAYTAYTKNYEFQTKGNRSVGYTRSPISERSPILNGKKEYLAGQSLGYLVNSLLNIKGTYRDVDNILQELNPEVDVYQSIHHSYAYFDNDANIQLRQRKVGVSPEGYNVSTISKARENIYNQRSSPYYWDSLNKFSEGSITDTVTSARPISNLRTAEELKTSDLIDNRVQTSLTAIATESEDMQKYRAASEAYIKEISENNIEIETDNHHDFTKGSLVGSKVFEESKYGLNQGLKLKDSSDIKQDRNIRQVSVDTQNVKRIFSMQLDKLQHLAKETGCLDDLHLYAYVLALNARAKSNTSTHKITRLDAERELKRLGITDSTAYIKNFAKSNPKVAKTFNTLILELDRLSSKYSKNTNEPSDNIFKILTPHVRNTNTDRSHKVKGIFESIKSGEPKMLQMDEDFEAISPYSSYNVFDSLTQTIDAVSKRAAIVENAERLKQDGVIDSISLQHVLKEAFSDPEVLNKFLNPEYVSKERTSQSIGALIPVLRRLMERFGDDELFIDSLSKIDSKLKDTTNSGEIIVETFQALSKKISSYKLSLDDALELANQSSPYADDVIYAYKQLQDLYAQMIYINKEACDAIANKLITYCDNNNLALVDKYGRKFDKDFMYAMNNTSLEYLPKALDSYLTKNSYGYNNFLVIQALSGNAFFMDSTLANVFAKRVFIQKPMSSLGKMIQKSSSWCTKMLMSSPFKLVDRFIKFTLFDTATLGSANHKTLFKQGEAQKDLRAFFSSKGSIASPNLEEFINTQGISFNGSDFDGLLTGDTSSNSSGMLKKYTDSVGNVFTFQTLSSRYAYWLSTKEALENGDYSVLGSAYHLKNQLQNSTMTKGEQASFAMAQILGSSNDFPAMAKTFNRYGFVFTTFPLAATRYGVGQLRSAGAAIHDLFTEGVKSPALKWIARNSAGIISTIILERLLVSAICGMYGVDEEDEDKEEWERLGALPNVTQTLLQGQPIMDTYSSMNPTREFMNLFISSNGNKDDEEEINGVTRFIRKNIIGHINPIVKNVGEVVTGKDLIDDQVIDTKDRYSGLENVFRKASSYFIGAAGSNALVNTFADSSVENIPSTIKNAAVNAINAELGNTKTVKENRKNYYKSIRVLNEYLYSDTEDLSGLTSSPEFNYARYTEVKSKVYKLINEEAPMSDLYQEIENFLSAGYTLQEIRAAFKNCSISGKLSKVDNMQDLLDALSEKDISNIKTALAYENKMLPWLDEGTTTISKEIKKAREKEYNTYFNIPSYYYPNNYIQSYQRPNYNQSKTFNNYKKNLTDSYDTYSSYLKNIRYQQQQAEYARKRKQWEDN